MNRLRIILNKRFKESKGKDLARIKQQDKVHVTANVRFAKFSDDVFVLLQACPHNRQLIQQYKGAQIFKDIARGQLF